VIAISEADLVGMNKTKVKSRVWVLGQDRGFNILEDVETVFKMRLGINQL
jgi:hypothetical protein